MLPSEEDGGKVKIGGKCVAEERRILGGVL